MNKYNNLTVLNVRSTKTGNMTISVKKSTKITKIAAKKSKNTFDIKKIKVEKIGYYVTGVTYDGVKLKKIGSCSRSIYRLDDMVIKIEPYSGIKEQTRNEIRFYTKKLRKTDAPYFPKFYAGDPRKGIIVTSYEKMYQGCRRSAKNRELVDQLVSRYDIGDIYGDANYNWGVCKLREIPVIYDIGFFD